MTRPNPHVVPRRPQAAAQRAVAYRPAHSPPFGLLSRDGRVDLDALHRALEGGEQIVEGGTYAEEGASVFAGSVTFELQGPADQSLRAILERDPRVAAAIHAQVRRAAARLLGPDTPETIRVDHVLRVVSGALRIHADFEGQLGSAAAWAG